MEYMDLDEEIDDGWGSEEVREIVVLGSSIVLVFTPFLPLSC